MGRPEDLLLAQVPEARALVPGHGDEPVGLPRVPGEVKDGVVVSTLPSQRHTRCHLNRQEQRFFLSRYECLSQSIIHFNRCKENITSD